MISSPASIVQRPIGHGLRADDLSRLLDIGAARSPDARFQALLQPEHVLRAADLRDRARQVAARLHDHGVGAGEVVGLLLPNSLEFVCAAFGILRSGAALAPLAVPAGSRNLPVSLARLIHIIRDAGIRHVVTAAELGDAAVAAGLDVTIHTPASLLCGEPARVEAAVGADDVALVQYTSGSTARPKGAALTHRQVTSGVAAIIDAAQVSASDTLCSWLPMSHDMGFIGLLVCAQAGADLQFSPPSAFIKRPQAWLEAFAAVAGTLYAGPSFSFQYLIDAFDDASRTTIDLRRWRLALNGAERVDPEVIERFTWHFAASGFAREAMFPVYGLAEATLAVTFPALGTAPRTEWVDRSALANERLAREVPRGAGGARGVVCVGRPLPGLELRIVTSTGGLVPRPTGTAAWAPTPVDSTAIHALPERHVGEIEVRGASVMAGYHRSPDATAAVLRDGWLSTGDLGYVAGGELFITGRSKEVMKLHGHSYFPEDIEALVRELSGVHRQRCVAFVVSKADRERMAVVVETELSDGDALASLAARARREITHHAGIDAFDVYLADPGSILVTTSGKYQRLAMRERVETGAIASCVRGAP